MASVTIHASNLRKDYNRRTIFSDISFSLKAWESLVITGRNGAGKSTLVKVLAGVLSSTRGTVSIAEDGKDIHRNDHFRYLGFVSPYLQLYEEFTAWELLELVRRIRGIEAPDELLKALLTRVDLYDRRNDFVRTYSSGMKQRMKYACALLHLPPILMLDEPTANLDQQGCEIVMDIVKEQKQRGIVIVATNEEEETSWCEKTISLNIQG